MHQIVKFLIDELKGLDEGEYLGDAMASPEIIPVLEKIGMSDTCSSLVQAMEKRLDDWAKLRFERIRNISRGNFSDPFANTTVVQELARLATVIHSTFHERSFAKDAIGSERRVLLKDFKNQVAAIKGTLDRLSIDFDGNLCVSEVVMNQVNNWTESEYISNPATLIRGEMLAAFELPEVKMLVELATSGVAYRVDELLEAYVRGVEEWASQKPVIPSPNAKNADRDRLIRNVSHHFEESFGTPLWQHVLNITGLFYDTGSMTPADASKTARRHKAA